MTPDAWIAAAVFVVAYVLIALERWDRTLIAMIGGLLVVVLGVLDQRERVLADVHGSIAHHVVSFGSESTNAIRLKTQARTGTAIEFPSAA